MSNLHRDIMNIAHALTSPIGFGTRARQCYALGHRDARHAAAELATAHDALVGELVESAKLVLHRFDRPGSNCNRFKSDQIKRLHDAVEALQSAALLQGDGASKEEHA